MLIDSAPFRFRFLASQRDPGPWAGQEEAEARPRHILVCMLVVVVVVLTIVGIVEINYFAPAIKLYCINDGLMIIRAHAEGKVEEARRWRKHLKRENYGKQPA